MISRVLFAALCAGILAGIAVSAMHFTKVVPLILQAETYEVAASHDHGAGAASHDHEHAAPAAAQGGIDYSRAGLTLVADIITGMGFALLLAAAILVSGRTVSARTGAIWGFAGFCCASLAPALGLAPELPGMPAAALADRQIWWIATVAATAIGGGLIVLQPNRMLKGLGLLLILAPHFAGAPQPESHASDVPAGLAASFAAVSLGAAAIFWLVLGTATGWLLGRDTQTAP